MSRWRDAAGHTPPFAQRDLWNMSSRLDHSGFAPENLITLAHFSVSSTMSLLKSEGEPANTVPPRSAIRALIRGSVRATLISLLSLSMISVGVFLGAATPCQPLDSYPGTKSPTVGRSGNTSERVAPVTANARNLPPLMCSIDPTNVSNMSCTCPPIISMRAGPAPRYGTWSQWRPVIILKGSAVKWVALPVPADAMFSLRGLALE